MTNHVTIVGSLNVDTTIKAKRMSLPGETIAALSKTNAAEGKGANQAVAAAHSGTETAFVGQIDDDAGGKMMIDDLRNNNVDTTGIHVDDQAGIGSTTILLDESGQSGVLVYGGANRQLSAKGVEDARDQIVATDFMITQFETPQGATLRAFQIAGENGVKTILNPAPAHKINPDLLKLTGLIIPNETESAALTGIIVTDETSMFMSAAKFAQMDVRDLTITAGAEGTFCCIQDGYNFIPAFKVNAVDTTAAGDTFIGTLPSQSEPDMSNIEKAVVYAQRASSLTVQKLGALPSIPTYSEIVTASKSN